jgi:hypothetical protein
MQQGEFNAFRELMEGVHSFYGKDVSSFALDVWWNALKTYDFAAVRDALGRHCVNPDNGQFLPRPADVVKMLDGSTLDSAVIAWTKIDRAVQRVGTYTSVVFDDPLIHRVLDDMGGWIPLGKKSVDEWPFVAKEFQTRYRGYKSRNERPPYPAMLLGISDGENQRHGMVADLPTPTLIGNPQLARTVLERGSANSGLMITAPGQLAAIIESRGEAA